jgi:hypothetical protein
MALDKPRLLKIETKPLTGRFTGQAVGLCLAAGLVGYSILFYDGYKEGHMSHWVWAVQLFAFVSTSLSRESISYDALFVMLGLVALTLIGRLYWQSQERVNSDFSFENEYLMVHLWFWGAVGFGSGRAIRWFRSRL